jgi:hypothetical protein
MNKGFTTIIRALTVGTLLALTSLALPALAQPSSGGTMPGAIGSEPGPGSGGTAPGAIDPEQVPIDAGASLLLASGVAMGLQQLSARHQARRTAKSCA